MYFKDKMMKDIDAEEEQNQIQNEEKSKNDLKKLSDLEKNKVNVIKLLFIGSFCHKCSKIFKVSSLTLSKFSQNFIKMLCSMIKACLKNFSSITTVFLKLQYSKTFR